jgi:hypothetical protein
MATNNGLNNKYILGYTTQAGVNFTSIVLTVASTELQVITGTATGASFTLPVESTMPNGTQFTFVNSSTQAVSITSSGGGSIISLAAGANVTVYLVNNSVTTAAAWNGTFGVATPFAQGTFSPTITFGGASAGTFNNLSGTYTKAGRLVFFVLNCGFATKSGNTGTVEMQGLPFASAAVNTNTPVLMVPAGNMTLSGVLAASVTNNASTINLFTYSATTGANTQLTDTAFSSSSVFTISGSYYTNS